MLLHGHLPASSGPHHDTGDAGRGYSGQPSRAAAVSGQMASAFVQKFCSSGSNAWAAAAEALFQMFKPKGHPTASQAWQDAVVPALLSLMEKSGDEVRARHLQDQTISATDCPITCLCETATANSDTHGWCCLPCVAQHYFLSGIPGCRLMWPLNVNALHQVQRSRCACLLAALYKPQSSSSGSSAAPPPALPPSAVLEAVLSAACRPTVTVSTTAAAKAMPKGGAYAAAGRAVTLRALLDLLGEPERKKRRQAAAGGVSLRPGAAARLACLVTSSCGSDEAVTEMAMRALLALTELDPAAAEANADDAGASMRFNVAAARGELVGQPGLVARLLQLCSHPEQCYVQGGGGSERGRLASSSSRTAVVCRQQRSVGGMSSSDGGSVMGSSVGGGSSASFSRSPGSASFSLSAAASTTSRRRRRQVRFEFKYCNEWNLV